MTYTKHQQVYMGVYNALGRGCTRGGIISAVTWNRHSMIPSLPPSPPAPVHHSSGVTRHELAGSFSLAGTLIKSHCVHKLYTQAAMRPSKQDKAPEQICPDGINPALQKVSSAPR